MVPGRRGHLIDYYQTPEWRALRELVLSEEPFCALCPRKYPRLSTTVDHIVPRPYGSDTRDNLRGVCASCHSKRTMRDVHA
jgi:5-methylcytosine-specific restriction endonuclease McrA